VGGDVVTAFRQRLVNALGIEPGRDTGISTPTPHRWEDDAVCRDHDPEVWFADTTSPIDEATRLEARRICGTCPVADVCYLTALERGEQHGVWGGVDFGYKHRNSDLLKRLNEAAWQRTLTVREAADELHKRAPLDRAHLLIVLQRNSFDYRAAKRVFGVNVSILQAIIRPRGATRRATTNTDTMLEETA
jgi:WhiB family transcriptional regulator, redox-sensing transcriptional regulator